MSVRKPAGVRTAFLAFILILGVAACGSGSSSADDDGDGLSSGNLTEVKVGLVRASLFAPLYVAIERGYMADEGIEISFETVASAQDAMPVVAAGTLDAGVGGIPGGLFNAVNQDLPIKILASLGAASSETPAATSLLVRTELHESGEVTSVADLKDRDVAATGGLSSGGGFNYVVLALEAEVDPLDANVVPLAREDMYAALQNGGVDAAVVSAPLSSSIIEEGIGVEIATPPEGFGIGGMFVHESLIDSGVGQRIFNALVRAAGDLEREGMISDEIAAMISKHIGQSVEDIQDSPEHLFRPDLVEPQVEWFEVYQQSSLDLGLLDYDELLSPEDYAVLGQIDSVPEEYFNG